MARDSKTASITLARVPVTAPRTPSRAFDRYLDPCVADAWVIGPGSRTDYGSVCVSKTLM